MFKIILFRYYLYNHYIENNFNWSTYKRVNRELIKKMNQFLILPFIWWSSVCLAHAWIKEYSHPTMQQLLIFTFAFWVRWVITCSCLPPSRCCFPTDPWLFICSHEEDCTVSCEMHPDVQSLAEACSSSASLL